MKSTGIYWLGLYNLLTAGGIAVVVSNPRHIRQILGLLLADYDHIENQKPVIERIVKKVIADRHQETFELLQDIS